jgi:hypothetical protein
MGDGFVVSPDCEFTSFQQETKVADCQKGGQQLSIEGRVEGLRQPQILAEESQRLPDSPLAC